jgi:isoleucyl-tRNA synthetase
MHVVNTILFDVAPFQNILTTGNVQAEDGKKMSKSKKNYPDPTIVIDKYGADALRFYLLTSSVVQAENMNFSERELDELSRKLLATLLNVHSFYRLFRTSGTITELKPEAAHTMDRWIMALLHQLQIEVTARMNDYDLVRAGKAILQFVNDLSTWYVRRTRDRVKSGGPDAESALNVMGYVIAELSKLLAPFTPMTSDYFYKDVTGNESVHLAKWNVAAAEMPMTDDEAFMLEAMEGGRAIVELGLSARKESVLKVRQPLSELSYMRKVENEALEQRMESTREEFQQIIADELNVKRVRRADQAGVHLEPVLKENAAYAVSLDVALTPELREEGLARELERQVQELRKKFGLQVGEMIDLYYNTNDASLEMALVGLFDRRKTFTMQVRKELEVEADFEAQVEVEGASIWLGIVKI